MTRRLAIEKTGSDVPTPKHGNGKGKRLDTLGVTIFMVIARENQSRKASIFTPGGVHIAGTSTRRKAEPQAGTQLERKLERTDMTRRLAIEKTGSDVPTAKPGNGKGKRLDTLGVTIFMVIARENQSRKVSIFTPGGVHIAGTSTRR
ncbi:Hypothetical predicted protein [Pelobates cultripes]|uniref:Uncharacterized protein n=1 Tax=Pelobates cultripes TaxID=61616 RepID=A0AAD1STA5_PELCU|nr:Hypothetical predicted protein [Pelobates cultripes]